MEARQIALSNEMNAWNSLSLGLLGKAYGIKVIVGAYSVC